MGCNSFSKNNPNELSDTQGLLKSKIDTLVLNYSDTIGSPQIEFRKTFINLDTIKIGDTVVIKYYFNNTGTATLEIEEIIPSCGCTTPNYSTSALLPGEQGQIVLNFESSNKIGLQNLNLVVVTNTYKKYYLLKFRVYVKS